MRVLVTGAGGFIGRHVLRHIPAGWHVVALSRQDPPEATSARWVRSTAPDALPEEVTAAAFDAVIHLAGNADHGLAVRAPWRDLEATGVVGAAILASIRASRIILLSSAAVYAGREGPVRPQHGVDPTMPYALSKRYIEGFARSRVADGHAEGATILRLYNAFGPGERPTRLVPSVVSAIRAGSPFRLTAAADSLSDPVYVDDVVAALLGAVETGVDGTWDVCGGDPRPITEQVGRIARALGREVPRIEHAPDPHQTPIRFFSDPAPLSAALGIPRPRAFEEGVRSYAREVGWLSD